jgi:hypothetical protein
MKILIVQENGRHEKNKLFRECHALLRGFIKNGVDAVCWGLGHENYLTNFEILEKWCDVIIVLENYTSNWLPIDIINKSKKIKIFWSIDSHVVLDNHIDICRKLKTNILLNSTEDYLPNFNNICDKKFWFPNAYDDSLIYPKNLPKIHDIGFCGNINNRGSWIDSLSEFNIKKDIFIIGDDMVNAINGYKIHFNRNIKNDINYRTFETTGCKTLLFTNYTKGLDKLFDIDKEIIVYQNLDDLKEKIKYYLSNQNKIDEISNLGYHKSKNNHTYNHRTKLLLNLINEF